MTKKNTRPDSHKHIKATLCAAMCSVLTAMPAFATGEDNSPTAATGTTVWTKASEIMQDVYSQIISISTVTAVVCAAVALLLIWYCDDIVNLALQIGGTPYNWILDSRLPGVQFGDFNSVLLVIIGVIANGSVALIALILVVVLAWNYLKLLLEAAERYIVLGILVFTAPLAFAMGAARGTNNIFKSWCRMFGGQLLLLIMNAWCLKLFVNMVGEFLANPLSL